MSVVGGLVLGLLIGGAIGGGIAADTQTQLDDTRADLTATRSDLSDAREASANLRSDRADLAAQLKRATAKAEVPSLTGGTVEDAQSKIEDLGTDWNVRARSQVSNEPEGTVVAQLPTEGTILRRGRSVTLLVAKPAPPSWKTIYTVSGSGSKRTDTFTIPAGLKIRVQYSFSGDTNAILSLNKPGDELEDDLLLNEIGDFSDTTRVYDKSGRYYFEIEGGSWNVSLQAFK